MSAVYSVQLKVKVEDEEKVATELQRVATELTLDNVPLEGTSDSWFRYYLAEQEGIKVTSWEENGFTYYDSDFNASYGWERVLIDGFTAIAPYLKNKSSLYISIENDYDKFVIHNHKVIQKH